MRKIRSSTQTYCYHCHYTIYFGETCWNDGQVSKHLDCTEAIDLANTSTDPGRIPREIDDSYLWSRHPETKNSKKRTMENQYQIYQIRRCLLADDETDLSTIRSALIVIDHLDWKTRDKVCASKVHFNNWIKRLGDDYAATPHSLTTAINFMTEQGYLRIRQDKGRWILEAGPTE